jgi:hypothetical protein
MIMVCIAFLAVPQVLFIMFEKAFLKSSSSNVIMCPGIDILVSIGADAWATSALLPDSSSSFSFLDSEEN